MIVLQNLTKEFSNGRGIFDLSLTVSGGEVFGYLGPNGAGKSTTIRHLMGFLRPDSGTARINDMDCWTQAASVQEQLGYLPGEIAFLDNMSGLEFLNLLAGMRKLHDSRRRNELVDRFDLDVKTPIRKMSKGMKQKVGIVAAFMHRPHVLVLDEPTSGLDPLMQQRFLELIKEEKGRGVTILMSSHMFPEVERVCDRVGILKDGKLIAVEDVKTLRQVQRKVLTVGIGDANDEATLVNAGLQIIERRQNEVDIEVTGNYNELIQVLAQCNIRTLDIHQLNLEEVFMHFYGTGEAL
ncbi:ABC transporter ATP-binding protein [Alicyclobacillus sp. ALC3]|uniref:ABC transporter ATP-binding protein n=1 Tax=Alicyclobacillus sp. ALC3 TaxID=2796143 RepID=UPI002379C714|nr:ABC transporter ATP-binding protein [Alicyclobacillus sp. ALC3]WDL98086.1 ABC transporter ATP-binding protein [Alicyclobacillus sp. ALC3]